MATFLSNEALKEVITGETHGAVASARLESNRVKIDTVKGTAALLRVLGVSIPARHDAAAKARALETRAVERLRPTDVHLKGEIHANRAIDHANDRHLALELAEVGFEIASSSTCLDHRPPTLAPGRRGSGGDGRRGAAGGRPADCLSTRFWALD